MRLRRFEILLPCRLNDGTPIDAALFGLTHVELLRQLGGVTIHPGTVHGKWLHEGIEYDDQLVRLVVDVPDTDESHEFFAGFKETLKERFRQVEVWITSHPIDRT